MKVRQGLFLLTLLSCLGTALALAVSGQDEAFSDVVTVIERGDTLNLHLEQNELTGDDAHYDLSVIKRTAPEDIRVAGLLDSKSWHVPAPPPPTSVNSLPPPQPTAPPLVFTFLGRIIDREDVTIFLSKNGNYYTVKVNDVLDGDYRVDKITVSNAVLTYIPLNIQQTLTFNSTAIGSSTLNEVVPSVAMPPSTLARQSGQVN